MSEDHACWLLIRNYETVLTEEKLKVNSDCLENSKVAIRRERCLSNLMEEVLCLIQNRQLELLIIFSFSRDYATQFCEKLQFRLCASWIIDAGVMVSGALSQMTKIVNSFVDVVLKWPLISVRLQRCGG